MNRRSVLKILGVGSVVATVGTGYWLSRERSHAHLALNSTINRLNEIDPELMKSSGAWPVPRTLNHLAQSVEFSMTGYPQMKSAAFQNTAGQLAFAVFQARGRMNHGLDQPIPGEVSTAHTLSAVDAMQNLIETLQRFDERDQELKPHFAYGLLDKSDYAQAHVMHINNHFEEMIIS